MAERISEHRRICILRALAEAPSYEGNESILHSVVDEYGLPCSRDQVRSELAWLRDQGLITLREVVGIYVVTITPRGEDVAAGRTTVPGVKRPSPR